MTPVRPCVSPGCSTLVAVGDRWCREHRSAYLRQDNARRGNPRETLYTYKWKKARLVYLAQHPLCVECLAINRIAPASVVDHVIPHRGDLRRFWDASNWQPLCASCHDLKTAHEGGAFGWKSGRFPRLAPFRVPCVLVAGPPAAGKSSYVAGCAAPGDLVLDLDVILAELTHRPIYAPASEIEWTHALAVRNARLEMLADFPPRWDRAYLIASAPLRAERSFWREHGASVVVMETPLVECERRIRGDTRRASLTVRHVEAVRSWWKRYQPDPSDQVISAQGQGVAATVG